ncbi:MAG: lysine--tRNA ligase [Clostridiales bacterium GWD2_32_19]|nr:MAG: lysine--tRNA ligase [Clostridiales bacterium GWD2_32_19]
METLGEVAYKAKFNRTHRICEIENEELGTEVAIAGRVVLKRIFGKLIFAQIYDIEATCQISLSLSVIGEEEMTRFKEFVDIGDFIGINGELYNTNVGELTVRVKSFQLLSKALRSLPEKFHGLSDQDMRYRQRYLDLIANESSRHVILTRFKIMQFIREFYNKHDFLEIETPILQNTVSGALAKPFHTHHNSLDLDVNLRISPETFHKRTLACGFDRIFEFAKDFRNEGLCADKLQEFTMLESYAAYWDFEDSIKYYTELFREVVKFVFGEYEFMSKGRKVILKEKFSRMDYVATLNNIVEFDILAIEDVEEFRRNLLVRKFFTEDELRDQFSIGGMIDLLYKRKMRPNIIEPTILYNYPNVVPLARFSDENPKIIELFQLVVNGQELVKGYSELINPIQQKRNFEIQQQAKNNGDGEAMDYDRDYLLAMEHGFPPCSGIGFGIDVFIQVILDCENIRDTILYPIMRPIE